MSAPKIDQPQGALFSGKFGTARLQWSTNFQSRWQGKYSKAQRFVDSEVLRHSEPFIPLLTGTLIKSGILGTDIGSGLVQWITPYARRQYYRGREPGTSTTGPLRGKLWFERMKQVSGQTIINGAKRIAGGE